MKPFFVGLILFGAVASADSNVTPPYSDNFGEAVIQALTAAASLPAKQAPTTISGVCDYKGGTCPGAKVNLYDGPKLIDSVTIDSSGVFRFHGLKDYFAYNVEVDYDRYKVKKMAKNIHPGKYPVRIEVGNSEAH
jgi:hypothetical protein